MEITVEFLSNKAFGPCFSSPSINELEFILEIS